MKEHPNNPREVSLQSKIFNVYQSLVATYGCHRAQVFVFVWKRILSIHNATKIFRQKQGLIDGHIRDLRMSIRIFLCFHKGLIAYDENIFSTFQSTTNLPPFNSTDSGNPFTVFGVTPAAQITVSQGIDNPDLN